MAVVRLGVSPDPLIQPARLGSRGWGPRYVSARSRTGIFTGFVLHLGHKGYCILPTFGLTRCRLRFASGVQCPTGPGHSVGGANLRRLREWSRPRQGGTVRPYPTRYSAGLLSFHCTDAALLDTRRMKDGCRAFGVRPVCSRRYLSGNRNLGPV